MSKVSFEKVQVFGLVIDVDTSDIAINKRLV